MRKISDFNSATEKYPVVYAGSASRPEYVDMPTILQQQEGTAPMDTLPAQWWNAMWKLATKDINAFRDYVGDAFTEINNLLTKFGITLDNADTEQLYDFFHDEYVQNYISTFFLSKNGGTVDGDLHIKGDLSVDGIGEEVISTELKVGANTITLRNDNPSALGNTELAGVVTENYDGSNHNNIIAIDKNGVARTGDIDIATRILYSNDGTNFYLDEELTDPATIGATEEVRDTGNQTSEGVEIYEGITYSNDDTEPLATREENPVDGDFMKWDGLHKRLVSGGSLSSIIDANLRFEYKDITDRFDAGIVSDDIANGDFSKYSLGNYIKKEITIPAYQNGNTSVPATTVTVRIVFAHFNLFCADELPDVGTPYAADTYANTLTPHVACIICDLPDCAMNSSNTTSGGYFGSYMHGTFLTGRVLTALSGVGITITDHLVKHSKLLTTSINASGYNRYGSASGCSNNWDWKVDQYISLMSEVQLFGSTIWSSSGFDTGEANEKLAIFNLIRHNKLFGNRNIWLRDVASATHFADLLYDGSAFRSHASQTYIAPAPLILLK